MKKIVYSRYNASKAGKEIGVFKDGPVVKAHKMSFPILVEVLYNAIGFGINVDDVIYKSRII